MTNYNDGKWHGWNGGECPVHPRSQVKTLEEDCQRMFSANAIDWKLLRGAFRVVKEYREPREFWIDKQDRQVLERDPKDRVHYIHVREVIE